MSANKNTTDLTSKEIRQWLIREIAILLHQDEGTIESTKDFDEYGLDSTDAVIVAGLLEERLAIELDPELLLRHRSVDDVVAWIEQQYCQRNNAGAGKPAAPTGGSGA